MCCPHRIMVLHRIGNPGSQEHPGSIPGVGVNSPRIEPIDPLLKICISKQKIN
jgi:hypothetical protein